MQFSLNPIGWGLPQQITVTTDGAGHLRLTFTAAIDGQSYFDLWYHHSIPY